VERLWAVRRVGDLIDQIDLHGQNRELVDELVALSMKYGLLTPYTSFLADERVQLHAMRENADRAGLSLQALQQVTGPAGVDQRSFKQDFMKAMRAPAPAARAGAAFGGGQPGSYSLADGSVHFRSEPEALTRNGPPQAAAPGPAEARRRAGGMLGGIAGRNQRLGNTMRGVVGGRGMPADDKETLQSAEAKVRQIGKKTFYFKNGRWVDSSVTPEDDSKAVVVVQFSDDYFRLARSQQAEYNQYFSQAEPVTVKLEGKVYRIDPAPSRATP
jgi:Ca-activated chloride channel family protein